VVVPVRFRVGRDEFARAVAWAARGAAARPAVAALGGVRLDVGPGAVDLCGLDHEVCHEARLPVTDAVPGTALVSGRLLAEVAGAPAIRPGRGGGGRRPGARAVRPGALRAAPHAGRRP
jgi:DNA polymerase III subunit beta